MGMGVGGGGLFVIYLTLCMNLPQFIAQGTNLMLFVIAGIPSMVYHLIDRKINLPYVFLAIILGGAGSLISSLFIPFINPHYARIALGALLVTAGVASLYRCVFKKEGKNFKKTLYK